MHLADFHDYLVRHQPSAPRQLSSLIAGTPNNEAYGEHLGPLRILCHSEVSGDEPDGPSPISADDEVEQLRRQPQQTEGELMPAFFLLDQYKRTLQSHPAPPLIQTSPPPPASDFLNSRLYRYVARPI